MFEVIQVIETEPEIYHLLQFCPYSILRKIQLKTYEAGAFELKQGEVYQNFYIIVSGEADIFTISAQGKKYFQTSYESGDVIGEMEIFEERPYLSYVFSKREITVLEIEREVFLQWIQLDQRFNQLFIQKLCNTSYEMFSRMDKQQLYSLKQRICHYLLNQLIEQEQEILTIHSDDLAQKMAVTQRSVNRILKELKDYGLVQLSRGQVHVLHAEGLTAILKEKENTDELETEQSL